MASGFDWIFPVVGQNEWSGGSWMPTTKTHRGRTHAAIDIYADRGAAIVTPVSGTVQSASTGKIGGNFVRILGDDGIIYYYAHLDAKSALRSGGRVERGSLVGYVGNSGSASSTSTHLHFSMRQAGSNQPVNPTSYLEGAYIIDTVPGINFDPARNEEIIQTVPYDPDSYGYAGHDSILEAVMGEAQGPTPATASEIVGGVLSSTSNMIAGGERMDYRGLGTTGVRQSDLALLVKEPGDESAVSEKEVIQEGLTVKEVGQQSAVEEVQGG